MNFSTDQISFSVEQKLIIDDEYKVDEKFESNYNYIENENMDVYHMIEYNQLKHQKYTNINSEITLKSNEKYKLNKVVDAYLFLSVSIESIPEYLKKIDDAIDINSKVNDITSIICGYNNNHTFKLIDMSGIVIFSKIFTSFLNLPNTPIPVYCVPYNEFSIVIESDDYSKQFKIKLKKCLKNNRNTYFDRVYVKDYDFFVRGGTYLQI